MHVQTTLVFRDTLHEANCMLFSFKYEENITKKKDKISVSFSEEFN